MCEICLDFWVLSVSGRSVNWGTGQLYPVAFDLVFFNEF